MTPQTEMAWKWGKWGAGALITLILFFSSAFTVEEYERGVVTRLGEYKWTAAPGLNFKWPFIEHVTDYRTDILSISTPRPRGDEVPGVSTYTVDNQEVHVVFTIQFRIPAENVEHVYRNVQDLRPRLFQIAEDRLKAELGKINTNHVAENRGKIRDGIKTVMQTATKDLGIIVTDFQLNNIEYDVSFKNAVKAAVSARANVETREQERQQEEKIAAKVIITAQGAATSTKVRGDADAYAIRVKGEAEAKAIQAQADALRANPVLVDLRKAEKWNGALPTQMLGTVMPWMNVDAAKGVK